MNARRRTFLLSSVFCFGLAAGASACAEDEGYLCTVTWSDAMGGEVGTEMYDYPDAGSAEEAADMCEADQDISDAKPDTAMSYACACASK